ncbi:MAG: hypothetical protein ACR2JB_19685 [Bryobacteraceae bacterium]
MSLKPWEKNPANPDEHVLQYVSDFDTGNQNHALSWVYIKTTQVGC